MPVLITRLAVIFLLLSGPALAHEGATGIVKERMDAFKESQDHLKALVPLARENNWPEMADRAGQLMQWGDKMTSYFPEGSHGAPSEAAMAIWEDSAGFSAAARHFTTQAGLVMDAAMTKDASLAKAAIKSLAASCKSCHAVFRSK